GRLAPRLLAVVLIIVWAAGRGVVALGHGRTVSARTTGSPGRHELLEQRLVPAHHRIAREAVLDPLAAGRGVEVADVADHLDEVVLAVAAKAGDAVVDELGRGAPVRGDDRRAARHRFDHHQPERLGPSD